MVCATKRYTFVANQTQPDTMTKQIITPRTSRKGTTTTTAPLKWATAQTLIKAAQADGDDRTALLVAIGIYTGLRISDILGLTWEQVQGYTFDVVEGKTKKRREIQVSPDLARIIASVATPAANGYIFTYRNTGRPITVQAANQRLKAAFEAYGIEAQNASSHTLRKTFARRVWEAHGKTDSALVLLSDMFNHKDTATTRKYIGLTAETIANAYLAL